MALPHYKLQTKALPDAPRSFPVLLAPEDPPVRFPLLKRILRSRLLLVGLQIIAVTAGASLLWIWLDPKLKTPHPLFILLPAVSLGLCCFLFMLIALVKNNPEEIVPEIPEEEPPLPRQQVSEAEIKPDVTGLHAEVDCEEWVSHPFQEIMDEAVIAEVFDDDLIAPDHLVFSVKVPEEVTD